MALPLATVGILSIGDMGMGVAKLLLAHRFRVVTNAQGRRYALKYPVLYFLFSMPFLGRSSSLSPTIEGLFH